MATNENSSWEKIQQGLRDVERLICQKEYNSAMVKARTTLEFMVRLLTDHTGITESTDLKNQIDALYERRVISKATLERYHKIRMIGNKAAHEGDANAYDANQAYHMLSQEVYAFSDNRAAARGARGSAGARRSNANRSRRRQANQAPAFTFYDLLKLLVPVLCIVLLFFVIKLVKPAGDGGSTSKTTAAVTTEDTAASDSTGTSDAAGETDTTEAGSSETMAGETSAAGGSTYKTTAVLNVRPQPSTDGDILGQLDEGSTVDYVKAHDDTWAVIRYNGQEAYVSSQFLTKE